MTIDEIFSKIATHMAKGVMIHNQLVNGFSFLGLKGYQKCQEYHYYEESKNYRCFLNYCLNHYHKIVQESPIDELEIIPTNWYKYMKMDVDTSTKKSGIRELIKKWINWEKETISLLGSSYKGLYDLGELAAAFRVQSMLAEVSDELAGAQEQYINLETINYDLSQVIAEQQLLYDIYKIKINNIVEDDDYD